MVEIFLMIFRKLRSDKKEEKENSDKISNNLSNKYNELKNEEVKTDGSLSDLKDKLNEKFR